MEIVLTKRGVCLLVGLFTVLLPLALSSVTYVFVSAGSNPISLDEFQGLLLSLGLMKLLLLGSTGVFPIDLDKLFSSFRSKRSLDQLDDVDQGRRVNSIIDNDEFKFKVPPVELSPCTRRFLCEMEMVARTSDNYEVKGPQALNGRNLEEEVAPKPVDPLTEMHIEAIRAFYKDENPTGDLTPATSRALALVEGLTGKSCEKAYTLCPGRFTAPMIFKIVFDELHYTIHDEL